MTRDPADEPSEHAATAQRLIPCASCSDRKRPTDRSELSACACLSTPLPPPLYGPMEGREARHSLRLPPSLTEPPAGHRGFRLPLAASGSPGVGQGQQPEQHPSLVRLRSTHPSSRHLENVLPVQEQAPHGDHPPEPAPSSKNLASAPSRTPLP